MNKFWKNRIEEIERDVVKWIEEYYLSTPATCVVIGISGGIDSSVAAALCAKAIGPRNVLGVMLPQGNQHDVECSEQLIKHLGIKQFKINIEDTVNTLTKSIAAGTYMDLEALTKKGNYSVFNTNLPARIRMTTLYGIAGIANGLVVNTCNRSENYIGYSTKFGDHAGDFSPLWNLTKKEIKMLGHHLGLPENLVEKTPEDGLSGKTDEENLGFTYEELDMYLLYNILPETDEAFEKIKKAHKNNKHKMRPMPAYCPPDFY